jgi:hypothetical protein
MKTEVCKNNNTHSVKTLQNELLHFLRMNFRKSYKMWLLHWKASLKTGRGNIKYGNSATIFTAISYVKNFVVRTDMSQRHMTLPIGLCSKLLQLQQNQYIFISTEYSALSLHKDSSTYFLTQPQLWNSEDRSDWINSISFHGILQWMPNTLHCI